MGIRIQQLPPAVANQIAAGEVIERPASVVKELLENSLDAGADTLTIDINYGGLNHIKISDNGIGIVAADLPLAVAAHATSKITSLNDLYAISSMGFRGEALASIASIAKVTISSRTVEQEHAMMLKVEGSEMSLTPCARTVGTTVEVLDLFFNAPVRKRFLKSDKLEFQAIEAVVKRFALSAPHLAITLKHNDKLIMSLPAARNEQTKRTRMAKILGTQFLNNAHWIDAEVGTMRLYGWVSGPDYQRSQNDKQWVYINQRMVKDKLINHALKQAYDGHLHPGRFPACLLYFNIDSGEVDVNVHPTKHEVRFQQPRLVHDFFTSQLSKALSIGAQARTSHYDPASQQQNLFVEINEPVDKQFCTVKKTQAIIKSDTPHHWMMVDNQFALIYIRDLYCLVDVVKLQQLHLNRSLKNTIFPLPSRPLLVPISYPLASHLPPQIKTLEGILEQWGLQIELIHDAMKIKTVPITMPYLDLRLLMDLVNQLSLISHETVTQAISAAHVFDPRLLNNDERLELNQLLVYLLEHKVEKPQLYKVLNHEVCRMLLNV